MELNFQTIQQTFPNQTYQWFCDGEFSSQSICFNNQQLCNNIQNFDYTNYNGFKDYHFQTLKSPSLDVSTFVPGYQQYQNQPYHEFPNKYSVSSSPNNSYSSAEQSPEQLLPLEEIDDLDLILNELENTNIDKFMFAKDADDFYNLLENLDYTTDSFNFDNSSLHTNTPTDYSSVVSDSFAEQNVKRKLPNDLSSDYCSSFEYDCEISTPSIIAIPTEKKRRTRRSKHTREERAARKKDQNKKAALRYRSKKKVETETIEQILEQLEHRRNELTVEYKKIEIEFNVILPLARAAFQHDAIRSGQLQDLVGRLSSLQN